MASALTRWRPFAEMEEFRRRIDRMFEELGDGRSREGDLAVDLIERDDQYVLRADIPGMKLEEVEIQVEDDILTVSAAHEETEEEKKENFVRRERRFGGFSRSIRLPKGVTAEQIQATCRDGMLEVSFPKPKEEERKAVTITPKAA